jgi:hypothetical protein
MSIYSSRRHLTAYEQTLDNGEEEAVTEYLSSTYDEVSIGIWRDGDEFFTLSDDFDHNGEDWYGYKKPLEDLVEVVDSLEGDKFNLEKALKKALETIKILEGEK